MVEFGWNEQLITCAEKIREMRFKPKSIFNRIAAENAFTGFPEDLDLKLSTELRDEIFRKFKFKSLTAKSSVAAILKNIYNTEFGNIYFSEKVSGTQNRTKLHACLNEYFDFVFVNVRKGSVRAAMCNCSESVLTDFCGHLLCGTCEKWALKRDDDGPEEYNDDPIGI